MAAMMSVSKSHVACFCSLVLRRTFATSLVKARMLNPTVRLTDSCSLVGKVSRVQSSPNGGHENSPDVMAFLGVPYAKPPVNALRFKPTQPVELWSGHRQATEYGSVCPQNFSILDKWPFPVVRPGGVSEDCLYLNIWTPTLETTAKLPVMFWIHGGGYVQGFSNLYDGTALAALRNVVFISFNYRLGPFGFLCTGDSVSPGNYGMLDQIEALKWVQKYISKFGGDPDNVTIFGESAGGFSVSLLLLSKLAKGLFKRGIGQSGTSFAPSSWMTPAVAAEALRQYFTNIGWPAGSSTEIVSHLQQQPATSLIGKFGEKFRPVLDNNYLHADVRDTYKNADYAPRDYMLGCNTHEGTFLVDVLPTFGILEGIVPKTGLDLTTLTKEIIQRIIQQELTNQFGAANADKLTEAVMKEYFQEYDTSEGFRQGLSEYLGDIVFVVPAIDVANIHSKTSKVYMYEFNHRPAFSTGPSWAVSDHCNEIPLVHGGLYLRDDVKRSPEDDVVAGQMMSYWTNFARTGDPNGEGLPQWPVYDENTKRHLEIGVHTKTETNLAAKRHTFWHDTIPDIIKSANVK